MATTANYLSFADRLSAFGTDGGRVDVGTLTTHWRVVNATARPTDIQAGMVDIAFYGLEILPTNADPLTVFIDGILLSDTETLREMLFHAQVKCSQDLSIVTALHESGQPLGELEPIGSAIPREQFSPVRSNILRVPANSGEKFASVELTIANHGANSIYLTLPALINHLDFYRNAYVRSARNYIPDVYWNLDFEQSDPQYPMYKLLDTLTHASDDVMQLFSDWFDHELDELSAGYTGSEDWTQSTLTGGSTATETNFDWLSQFTGGELQGNIVGTDEPAGTVRDFYTTSDEITAFLRWQLENSYYGRAAGTREAMIAAAQQVLSATKGVAIIPHYGADPWKIQVQTLRSETQDFDAGTFVSADILDAVAAAAPMGYEIFHMAVLFFAFTLGNVGLGRLGLGVLGGPGGYVPPDAPTGLTITVGGTPSTELTLTWVAPLYNGGNAVSGYLIRRDGSIIVANTGNTNVTHTDTGRTPGTAYSYTVAAINGAGAGSQSTSASGTTDAIVPDAPTGLTLAAGSTPSSMIDLTWVAPAYTGGATIIGYRITENNVVVINNTGSSTVTLTRTGLSRGTSYTYKIAALNSAGTGADSSAVSLTTAAELPDAPTGLTLTAGSPANTVISLAWTAPVDNGGAAISGYRIKRNGSTIVADTGGTATTYSATGLTHNTAYTFNVAAINSAGTGGDSTTASRDTLPNGIGATGGTITTYGNYRVHTFLTDGTFEITSNLNSSTFEVLMVGGGGGGGGTNTNSASLNSQGAGGGGGGGGVRVETSQTGTVQTYAAVVGEGGAVQTHGEGTEFGSLKTDATNGQGGVGGDSASGGNNNGSNAAGGGGSGAGAVIYQGALQNGLGGSGGQDFNYGGDGGASWAYGTGGTYTGGGGGGGFYGNDGGQGANSGANSKGGDGGDGLANAFQTGSNQYYGGGGGGGFCVTGNHGLNNPGLQAAGGSGGGGGGEVAYENTSGSKVIKFNHVAGTDGTGGGGGGGANFFPNGNSSGGAGGDGIVVVRYSTQ